MDKKTEFLCDLLNEIKPVKLITAENMVETEKSIVQDTLILL